MKTLIVALLVWLVSSAAMAGEKRHSHTSKYAGQETRAIKSLSPDDIAELRRGGGWGLARAAELNGVPGPVHLLELKDEIPLTAAQVKQIRDVYEDMRKRAMRQGEVLIERERELEEHFRNGTIDDRRLLLSLDRIAAARKTLRYIHLATHLKTPEILTPDQIEKYNRLRGYAGSDPCSAIPKGHDAAMWRKHNGCN
jgi:Spy/CpxP family protein refolding chaperone